MSRESDSMVAETRSEHAALTQLHRWYAFYERPRTPERLVHQLEILAPDVQIAGARGVGAGHAAYCEVVAKLSPDEQHAHHVLRTQVRRRDATTIALEAEILYQMRSADRTVTEHRLHYDAALRDVEGKLPEFVAIAITPSSEGAAPAPAPSEFVDVYAENRATSFLHGWLWLIEDVGGGPERFQELLAVTELALEFSTSGAPITSYEQFAAWHARTVSQVRHSSHVAENLEIGRAGDDYRVAVDLRWSGIGADGRRLAARTHHDWLLIERGERFPRMRHARVVQVEPFHEVE